MFATKCGERGKALPTSPTVCDVIEQTIAIGVFPNLLITYHTALPIFMPYPNHRCVFISFHMSECRLRRRQVDGCPRRRLR